MLSRCTIPNFAGITLQFLIVAASVPSLAAGDVPPVKLNSVADARALTERVDRGAATLARDLTPNSRTAYLASVIRLHEYAAAHCGYYAGQKTLEAGEGTCLLNVEGNFLSALPQSIYPVGKWRVYETAVYGIEWADDALLGQDPDRPFWWDLEITWPRVDADPSPVPLSAMQALRNHVHERIASWATDGWSLKLQVRLEAINDCYLSASIVESEYGGGAHPNGNLTGFTWNRTTNRQLMLSDLFVTDRDWRTGLLALYRNRLSSGPAARDADGLDDRSLAYAFNTGWLVTDTGLRLLNREGSSRAVRLPDIDLKWDELTGWLSPGAACHSN